MNKNQRNIKKSKYILKRCVPLIVYTMSKVHENVVFQKIRVKPRHIVIKSFTLPTISNCLKFMMQFSWMSVFFAGKGSNLGIVKRLNIMLKG